MDESSVLNRHCWMFRTAATVSGFPYGPAIILTLLASAKWPTKMPEMIAMSIWMKSRIAFRSCGLSLKNLTMIASNKKVKIETSE